MESNPGIRKEFAEWKRKIDLLMRAGNFGRRDVGGILSNWDGLDRKHKVQMDEVMGPMAYLNAMTFLTLASEYEQYFLEEFKSGDGILDGERIARLDFFEGKGKEEIKKLIDLGAQGLLKKYPDINADSARLESVYGWQSAIKPISEALGRTIKNLET